LTLLEQRHPTTAASQQAAWRPDPRHRQGHPRFRHAGERGSQITLEVGGRAGDCPGWATSTAACCRRNPIPLAEPQ